MWEKVKEKKSKDKPMVHPVIEEIQHTSSNPINVEEEEFIQGTLTSEVGNPRLLGMEARDIVEKNPIDERIVEDTLHF